MSANNIDFYEEPQALEVWPLNPLKCLKYEITVALYIMLG